MQPSSQRGQQVRWEEICREGPLGSRVAMEVMRVGCCAAGKMGYCDMLQGCCEEAAVVEVGDQCLEAREEASRKPVV